MGEGDQGRGNDAEDAALVCRPEVWPLHQRSFVETERDRHAGEMGGRRSRGRRSQGCAGAG